MKRTQIASAHYEDGNYKLVYTNQESAKISYNTRKSVCATAMILASTGMYGKAYEPCPKPVTEIVSTRQYIQLYKVDRPGYTHIQASEVRRKEILAQIAANRQQLRDKVVEYRKKKLMADIDKQTLDQVYADRLINRLLTDKI